MKYYDINHTHILMVALDYIHGDVLQMFRNTIRVSRIDRKL